MPARSSFSLPRFVLRGHQPRWLTPAAMASAVVFTVLLTAIPIRLAGANPPATFERYLVRPLSTQAGVFEVLLTATPLMFTGLRSRSPSGPATGTSAPRASSWPARSA